MFFNMRTIGEHRYVYEWKPPNAEPDILCNSDFLRGCGRYCSHGLRKFAGYEINMIDPYAMRHRP